MTVFPAFLSFIDAIGFDPFFRGFLSVLTGVVVLIGGTYLIIASNSGSRTGGLIASTGFFGWMFLMGVVWTIYAIGWVGESESWALVEINFDDPTSEGDGLTLAETERVNDLGDSITGPTGIDLQTKVSQSADSDARQVEAVEYQRSNADAFDGWRYLATSDPRRGEATASATEFLAEEHVLDDGFVPLTFGAWNTGGKPLLDPEISEDDPDKSAWVEMFTDAPARIIHKIDTTFIHFWHPRELVVIQVQGTLDQPTLPGDPPPVATPDPDKPVVSVVMERDRGGPLPVLFGGERVTPALFTIFNGILFAVLAWMLHTRDKREQQIRAAAAA